MWCSSFLRPQCDPTTVVRGESVDTQCNQSTYQVAEEDAEDIDCHPVGLPVGGQCLEEANVVGGARNGGELTAEVLEVDTGGFQEVCVERRRVFL